MDSNTHSTPVPARPELREPAPAPGLPGVPESVGAPELPDDLAGLAAVVDELAAHDLDRLSDMARAARVLGLRRLLDRLEGQWLKELAGVDARGAAGADQAQPVPSTAGWLRNRLRMGTGAARDAVRTARALFRGPLPETAHALTSGAVSPAHARALAQRTHQLPDHVTTAAEPVLVEAARRLDPPRLRDAVGHLLEVADPDGADAARERRHDRRGLWLSPTLDGLVAVDGLLDSEAGHTVLAALEPLARPADAEDRRTGGQRTADALTELAHRALEGGRLPQAGGVRPQLLVTVDLDSLLGRPGAVGGELGGVGWAGPLDRAGCRRLACDGSVTRVLVTRDHPNGRQSHLGHSPAVALGPPGDLGSEADAATDAGHGRTSYRDPDDPRAGVQDLQGRLRAAMALLPRVLGGVPRQPLDVGRTTRVVQPAQRLALAVRDQGCVFPGCDRPLAWCDAHHLRHWLDGGPTDLANLALLCRAHHRTVHEGGWQLTRGPDGRFTASPPHRRRCAA